MARWRRRAEDTVAHRVPGRRHEPVAARPQKRLQLQQLPRQEVLLAQQPELTQHVVVNGAPRKQGQQLPPPAVHLQPPADAAVSTPDWRECVAAFEQQAACVYRPLDISK